MTENVFTIYELFRDKEWLQAGVFTGYTLSATVFKAFSFYLHHLYKDSNYLFDPEKAPYVFARPFGKKKIEKSRLEEGPSLEFKDSVMDAYEEDNMNDFDLCEDSCDKSPGFF